MSQKISGPSGNKPNQNENKGAPNFSQKPKPDMKPKHFGKITKSTIRAEQDVPPFTYQGEKIVLIAHERVLRAHEPKPIRYFYKIEKFKVILYNSNPKDNLYHLIAGTNTPTPYDKEMPFYWDAFNQPNREWLELNKIDLVS